MNTERNFTELEAGKTYKARDGSIVNVTDNPISKLYVFRGDNGKTYTKKGDFWGDDSMYPVDLIELIQDEGETMSTNTNTPDITPEQAYAVLQAQWIKDNNIEVDDIVRVVRKARSYEMGWDNTWYDDTMDVFIGSSFVILKLGSTDGIKLCDIDYYFPFFALELVKKGNRLPEPIPLDSGAYKVEFNSDRSISVGCQDISFETLKKIYKTAKSVGEHHE